MTNQDSKATEKFTRLTDPTVEKALLPYAAYSEPVKKLALCNERRCHIKSTNLYSL